MSEAEMNFYRFGSGKEPSDEMLADGAMVKNIILINLISQCTLLTIVCAGT